MIPWQVRPEYTDPNFYNLIVDDLGATAVRAAVLPNAEKVNDNADPNNLDLSKFDPNALAETFDFFQQMQQRGVNTFVTSVWSAPAWMKTNAIYTDGGSLRPTCTQNSPNISKASSKSPSRISASIFTASRCKTSPTSSSLTNRRPTTPTNSSTRSSPSGENSKPTESRRKSPSPRI